MNIFSLFFKKQKEVENAKRVIGGSSLSKKKKSTSIKTFTADLMESKFTIPESKCMNNFIGLTHHKKYRNDKKGMPN